MNQLWKWIMQLNAKAFVAVAFLLLLAVAGWCGYQIMNPPEPLKDGGDGAPKLDDPPLFTILEFVENQMNAENLTIPVDPFRPTVEAIFTNETERAAFLKALKAAQSAAAGAAAGTATPGGKKEDPFAHLRRKDADQATGAAGGGKGGGPAMVTPKLTFQGFISRPDGTQAALFHNSLTGKSEFYSAGDKIHTVDLTSADVRNAVINFPDGTSRSIAIGEQIELAQEQDTRPPPKAQQAPPNQARAPARRPAAPGDRARRPGGRR